MEINNCEGWTTGIPCEMCHVRERCADNPCDEQNHIKHIEGYEEAVVRFITKTDSGNKLMEEILREARVSGKEPDYTKIANAVRNPRSDLGIKIYNKFYNKIFKDIWKELKWNLKE